MIEQIKAFAHDYGAISALVITTIFSIIRYFFGAKAKIIWHSASHSFDFQDNKTKEKKNASLQVVTLENVGRGPATGIEIIIPRTDLNLTIQRLKSGWSLHNDTVLTSDHNFEAKEIGENTKIVIPSLEGRQLLVITYGSIAYYLAKPTSISYDGKIAESKPFEFRYFRHRDVYIRSLKSTWFLWLMVLWLVIAILIPGKN